MHPIKKNIEIYDKIAILSTNILKSLSNKKQIKNCKIFKILLNFLKSQKVLENLLSILSISQVAPTKEN